MKLQIYYKEPYNPTFKPEKVGIVTINSREDMSVSLRKDIDPFYFPTNLYWQYLQTNKKDYGTEEVKKLMSDRVVTPHRQNINDILRNYGLSKYDVYDLFLCTLEDDSKDGTYFEIIEE